MSDVKDPEPETRTPEPGESDFALTPEPKRPRVPFVAPEPGLVSSGEVAGWYRITTQAVRKWVDEGLPVRAVDTLGRRWFDQDDVRRWVAANRVHRGVPQSAVMMEPAGLHGGTRPGSGRPPRGSPRVSPARRGRPPGSGRVQRMSLAERQTPRLDEVEQEPEASARPVSGLVYEKTRHEQLKAESLELELAKKRRELLNRSEVEAAIVAAARNLGGLCESIGRRAAGAIVSACSLTPDQFVVIEDLLRRELDSLVEAMLDDPLGDEARGETKAAA